MSKTFPVDELALSDGLKMKSPVFGQIVYTEKSCGLSYGHVKHYQSHMKNVHKKKSSEIKKIV
jgi:hypothetical protein